MKVGNHAAAIIPPYLFHFAKTDTIPALFFTTSHDPLPVGTVARCHTTPASQQGLPFFRGGFGQNGPQITPKRGFGKIEWLPHAHPFR